MIQKILILPNVSEMGDKVIKVCSSITMGLWFRLNQKRILSLEDNPISRLDLSLG